MLEYHTDWLASTPVFYNEKSGKVSNNINDVIDYVNLEFDPEGFNNYLDFGYSVFEQTPIKHVKFLRHSSKIVKGDSGELKITLLDDPSIKYLEKVTNEDEIINLLQSKINIWESSVDGEIVIPTSGGYDSRLLNHLISDKNRIRSFTYGISSNQAKSYEVVFASKLAEILKIKWEQIQLKEFHDYFKEWNSLFGISTHAHGMYHIEFYKKISSRVKGNNHLLSGIIGDAWAGNWSINPISNASEVQVLGCNHDINANSNFSKFKNKNKYLLEKYYNENAYLLLNSEKYRIIQAMRLKMILLSYLIKIPDNIGFKAWSPFLDVEVALGMLNLPPERRINRIWQKEYFQKNRICLEEMNLKYSTQNTLDLQGIRNVRPPELNVKILGEYIQPNYIEWVNQKVAHFMGIRYLFERMLYVPKIGGLLSRAGVKKEVIQAYNAYLTLKPIEELLIKRNSA